MKITRGFTFSAAHLLPTHKGLCAHLHGHTYKLEVSVKGKIQRGGLVLDFAELKKYVNEKVISKLDHSNLNDFFEHPSAENVAVWIWDKLKNIGKGTKSKVKLVEIKLWEGDNAYVTYEG